ncbi:OmpA family protein [Celeribacter litoreus]|uniref:OmpA family protein n=1 Tax=Celeribacter litoreus TaxID=2876714 RepID=UPI001CCA5A42|nr:OmpA family protein [Celeribacter litoreus]MCA0044295.1 OmpA family protein [Celeribacter litoreus]
MTKFLPVFAAILAGAVLSLAGAAIGARVIESTSTRAVTNQLKLRGYEFVSVEGDGLQIVLTGTAPDEQTQLAAQRAAGHVVDPARVINVMSVVQQDEIPAPKFSIEILRNDSGISLIGLVPSAWERDTFVRNLQRAAGSSSVADLMEQADYPAPETWGDAMDFGVTAIALLPRSKISLAADEITVTALADSAAQKARFERDLERDIPADVPVTLAITAPRPVITPFTARVVIDEDGPRFDACVAETETGHARLLAAAKAIGIENPTCTIGLGSPSAQWAAAVETGMRALQELGQGAISFTDGEVNLVAAEGTSEAVFDEVVAELEADLPPNFTLRGTLPETEVAADEEAIPEFIAIRSPEGQTQLRGHIADERSKLATEALARASFGAHTVYSAMRVDPELPNGWAARAVAAIEALAYLNHGAATMTEDSMLIRGETYDPDSKASIASMLSDKLGATAEYTIDVTYVERIIPEVIIPTAEECVASANAILAESKITFDPGSTDLNSAANATLDEIADALKDCEDIEMEIGAHSDSQGRESTNLSLSNQRANSVLDGLLMRRVAGVDFTARGYGESQPIASNETEEGREANRRIEFKLVEDEEEIVAPEDAEAATDDAEPVTEDTEEVVEEPAEDGETQ